MTNGLSTGFPPNLVDEPQERRPCASIRPQMSGVLAPSAIHSWSQLLHACVGFSDEMQQPLMRTSPLKAAAISSGPGSP